MDFWFLLKNSISVYIHPLTIAMELIVTGVVLVGFSRRHGRKPPGKFGRWLRRASGDVGVGLVITGIFFLFLCSIKPVADPLVYSLEKLYPPLPVAEMSESEIDAVAPAFIVVLAGGERYDPGKPPTSQLSYAALARVNEGARLSKFFPKATVVFTGKPDEVRAMTEAAIDLGIVRDRIQSESESRDTKDHPVKLRPIIGAERFLLVTSGTHMPRAMALFKAEGYDPIAASCDLWVWPRFGEKSPYQTENFIPKVESLWMTHVAFHEYLGLAWVALFEADQDRGGAGPPASEPAPAAPKEIDSIPPIPDPSPALPLPKEPESTRSTPEETESSLPAGPTPEDAVQPTPRQTDSHPRKSGELDAPRAPVKIEVNFL